MGRMIAYPTRAGSACYPRPILRSTSEAAIVTDPADVILKRFDEPDEVREMPLGRFELITLGGRSIGRATYQPGWRWSEHVGPGLGRERCPVEHVGLVISGTATAAFADGRVVELRAGEAFYIPPVPHDSWVGGDEPYVSLHLVGAEHYATDE
jgi:mannose-6-phosphate isomerase-like protein (cupin superfamily)